MVLIACKSSIHIGGYKQKLVRVLFLLSNIISFKRKRMRVRIVSGAQVLKYRSTDNVERFLLSIRFENRKKLEEMGLDS